ncbi:glucokinase [Solemya velesiana gill symbiont]|uniref:Glucokinase n=1 Tax=Solemya velesiana gill symbiont TaxID=1918948 RepID=A0A1T2KXL9_9GAMM|nr:glucokinase [Solemya velesiana gill symbiont]OOZ37510.1 glucokinase [Solemya velesiana gill symbiont]
MDIITGDIGGTNARLALCRIGANDIEIVTQTTYPSGEYASLEKIVKTFSENLESEPDAACFGLPCPITGGVCNTTNLPWKISQKRLQNTLGGTETHLINDLEALAWGIGGLSQSDFLTLQEGNGDGAGNAMVIAAGTGLGQAGLYWDGDVHLPFATEGGHCDFAPADELQIELLRFAQRKHQHVSWERLVSGPGLATIYDFMLEYRDVPAPDWFEELKEGDDVAEIVSTKAIQEVDDLYTEAVGLFIRLLGTEAGNQALKMKATGGVFIGGGIAPKMLDWIQMPFFMEAFLSKGRMRPLLEQMPVHVITTNNTALLGAAIYQQSI